MSDIVVEPCGADWTVRHPRILFERFKDQSDALRRARRLSSILRASGEQNLRLKLREARSQDAVVIS
jgi:hypothetical protein